MDASFWLERWQNGDIGFHRDEFHPALNAHWMRLEVPPPATVFVPLCGKSLDMQWLARRGHRILAVELSELAVDAFFAEQRREPSTRREGPFAIKSAGPFEIWCGDIFQLPEAPLATVGAVYDRASLVAFPPRMQSEYAGWLATSLPAAPALIVSLAYDESQMNGPPFSIPERRVRELLEGHYTLEVLERKDALKLNDNLRKRGLTALVETVFLARKHA